MRTSNLSVGMRRGGGVRNGVALAALAVVLAAGQPQAMGTVVAWNNALGGTASVSTNWSPNQVPVAADDATFSLVASYAVTFNSLVQTTRTQTYGATSGTVTLTCSSPHTVTNGITIGDVNGDNATMTLTTGTLTSNAGVVVGNAIGSIGRLNVNDDDADLILATSAGDLTIGNNGAGTLSITGGGLVDVADRFSAGSNSTSISTVTVSGFTIAPVSASTLLCRGTSVAAAIGAGGDATFNISTGALAHFFGSLNIAQGSASTSTATVGGVGLLDARLQVDGNLNIAGNQGAGAAAGNGTLTINADGDVTVAGATNVGNDPDGGTGLLNVNNGATLTTHDLIVNDTRGTLNLAGGGIIFVVGGTLDPRGTTLTIDGGGLNSVIRLIQGATSTLVGSVATPALTVGNTGQGQLQVIDAGSTLTCTGSVSIGEVLGSDGVLVVDAGAAASLSGTVSVANRGTGLVNVVNGSSLTTENLFIGRIGGASGTLDVQNPGTTWTANGVVGVGGDTVAGGTGVLNVLNAAHGHVTSNLTVWNAASTLNVDNATLDVDGTLDARGPTTLTAGTINTALFTMGGTSLTGSGTVNGRFLTTSGSSVITATGNLTLGDAADANGFSNIGTLNVGANTVTLRDANGSVTGNATIAGGHLAASTSLLVPVGRVLSGFGTIDSPVLNFGTLTATGAGLTLNGLVTGVGQGIGGTLVFFGSTGGFTGSGTISAKVASAPGSVIETTGTTSLGDGSTGGISIAGELHVNGNVVTLDDSATALLASLVTINSGRIEAPGTLQLTATGHLRGDGLIVGSVVNLGMVEPIVGSNSPALVTVQGSYTGTAAGSKFLAQLVNASSADHMAISGTATIGGSLTVGLRPGFIPTAAATYTILSANGGVTGQFVTTTLPPHARVRYNPTTVQIVFCPADFNNSGTVTVQDIFDFLAAWFAGNPSANFNGIGAINVQDIFDFLSAWFAGC